MLLGLTSWLIPKCPGYKGLSKIQITKINFKIYVYWLRESYLYIHGQRTSVIKNRVELKKDAAKEKYINFIVQGWRITEKDWTKKETQGCKSFIGGQIILNY